MHDHLMNVAGHISSSNECDAAHAYIYIYIVCVCNNNIVIHSCGWHNDHVVSKAVCSLRAEAQSIKRENS